MSNRTRVSAMVAVGALIATTLAASPAHSARASAPTALRAGQDDNSAWAITRVDDAWHITLHLAEPAPIRDAPSLLAVDGRPVGVARESADHRTLTVVSDARGINPRGRVTLWSPDDVESSDQRAFGRAPLARSKAARTLGALLPIDPGTNGPFGVSTSEYDLGDEAVLLPALNGHKGELRARVYTPNGATGRRPLVLFLHGRHQPCFGDAPEDVPWPCAPGNQPVPSFRGYDVPANALASNGYLVVSISANAINALDFETIDGGALARAQLVLAHLDLWKRWSTSGGGPFGRAYVGRVNLNNIGLMGHSRGGEGVVRAALLNGARTAPYGIRALVALAPTDFARPTIPGVSTSVILPYCDGDVIDLQGQHFYDDTRYAVTGDDAIRSTVLIQGTNHNFFNTEWTPGLSVAPSFDDWFGDPNGQPCGVSSPQRLNVLEQLTVGRAYIAGWFRMVLGRQRELLPLFDGSGARVASAGRAEVDTVAHMPADARRDLARFESSDTSVSSANVLARRCSGVPFFIGPPASTLPFCTAVDDPSSTPHWTPAFLALGAPMPTVTNLRWISTDGRLRVSLGSAKRNLSRFSALTVRLAPDPSTSGPVDLTIRITDGDGNTKSTVVSNVSKALDRFTGVDFGLPKTLLRTVRIPLATLKGIDLSDVRTIDFLTNRVSTGSVFVSDLAAVKPSIGASGPTRLPRLSTHDLTVTEGDSGTQLMRFRVRLSRPSTRTVRVHVDAANDFFFGDEVVTPVSKKLVFLPGQTQTTVAVRVRNNVFDGPDRIFPVVLAIPTEAVLDQSIGVGTVLDDDPTPTVRIGNTIGFEAEGEARFPLTLSAPTTDGVFVDAEVTSGTAVLGSDMGPDSIAFGFIEPGSTTGSLVVPLIDDTVAEPNEAFTVQVFGVFGALLTGPDTATGTIVDND